MQAANRLKNKGLVFNGKFDPINNPGCLGHFDDDIEKLLLEDGWVKSNQGTHIVFEKPTGRVFNNGTIIEKDILDWNPVGDIHSPDPRTPIKYWKLKDSNNKIKYRSTIDSRFTNYNDIPEPIFISGKKIN